MPFKIKVIVFVYVISIIWHLVCKIFYPTEYAEGDISKQWPWFITIMVYLVILDILAFIYLLWWLIFVGW